MTGAVTVRMILHAVGHAFEFPAHHITHQRRSPQRVDAQDAACWLAADMTPYSYPQIGRCLGDRDHTTIMEAVRRAKQKLATDEAFAGRVATARQIVLSSLANAERWQDADAVVAADRLMSGEPWREATRISVDEIVAISARAVALEEVAATTYQLLAHLDEIDRLRPRPDDASRLRAAELARAARAMGDSLADALQGLGYEYAEPQDQENQANERAAAE